MMTLTISGYELGQFLRILLWICVPAGILFMMITTWLQYRRRYSLHVPLLLTIEGGPSGEEMEKERRGGSFGSQTVDGLAPQTVDDRVEERGRPGLDGRIEERDQLTIEDRVEELAPQTEDDYKENLYKGILWMKEKYEQYRDLADERYSRLKDQLTVVEKRYEDLLAAASNGQPMVTAGQANTGAPEQRAAAVEGQSAPALESQSAPTVDMGLSSPEAGWISDDKGITAAAAPAPVEGISLEREERSHSQELEEKFARTRQRLEEELSRVRYQLEEQVSRSRRQLEEQAADSSRKLEQQAIHSSRQLEEKQRIIADLESQLRTDRQKIEELVAKLKNNSVLLMNIYQELDKSIHHTDIPGQQ